MNDIVSDKTKDLYANYQHYNTVLRSWFIGFGVGGPVILISNNDVLLKLKATGCAYFVGSLFFVGVGIQIIISFINKTVGWCNYFSEENNEFANSWQYKTINIFNEQYWLDILADLISIVAFTWVSVIFIKMLT
jgi:hypothetical protein